MATYNLPAPLAGLDDTPTLRAYRADYQRYRLGCSAGAKGEINIVVDDSDASGRNNKLRADDKSVYFRFSKSGEEKDDGVSHTDYSDDYSDSESDGTFSKTTSQASLYDMAPEAAAAQGVGPYELAQDVTIPASVLERSRPFKTAFERSKKMRSEVIVESGLINNLATRVMEVIPVKCHKSTIYVVTDSVTDGLYGAAVADGLESAGLNVTKLVIESSTDESGENSTETTKNLPTYGELSDAILSKGVDKRSCIVSVGGGVINNICGFVAGTIYRGITLVHFSTTMMGQVDAAIDFKQAVNHGCGKNLLGCYYPASKIILDPSCLATQSERHLRNGLAEALKHGVVHSTELLDFILSRKAGSSDDAEAYLDGVVRRTISVKVPTLTRYEESDFNEMAPQYGHAPAHAVEFLTWHGGSNEPMLHGEAVAIGMCVSAEVALIMGICTAEVVAEHYRVVETVGLPSRVPAEMNLDDVCAKLAYDKHTLSGKPTMGLCVKMGQMYHDEEGSYGIPIEAHVLRDAFEINQLKTTTTL